MPFMFSSCNIPERGMPFSQALQTVPVQPQTGERRIRSRQSRAFCVAQHLTQLPARFRLFSNCNGSKEHGWAAD